MKIYQSTTLVALALGYLTQGISAEQRHLRVSYCCKSEPSANAPCDIDTNKQRRCERKGNYWMPVGTTEETTTVAPPTTTGAPPNNSNCAQHTRRRRCDRDSSCTWDGNDCVAIAATTVAPPPSPTTTVAPPPPTTTVAPPPSPTTTAAPPDDSDCDQHTRRGRCNRDSSCTWSRGSCIALDAPPSTTAAPPATTTQAPPGPTTTLAPPSDVNTCSAHTMTKNAAIAHVAQTAGGDGAAVEWLRAHNSRRWDYHRDGDYGRNGGESLQPRLLVWDEDAAAYAQTVADSMAANCKMEHSDSYGAGYGENLAVTTASSTSPEAVVAMWWDMEFECNHDPMLRDPSRCPGWVNGMTGHFTAAAWYTTSVLGCAFAYNPNCGQNPGEDGWKTYSACNYGDSYPNCGRFSSDWTNSPKFPTDTCNNEHPCDR